MFALILRPNGKTKVQRECNSGMIPNGFRLPQNDSITGATDNTQAGSG